MYVAVKGGETADRAFAPSLLADERRGDRARARALARRRSTQQLALAVDRVMTEGSLYDRELAALAIKQARGDLIEAIFLLRAYRTTLPRFGDSRAARHRAAWRSERRISAHLQGRAGRPGARARPTTTPTGCSTSRWPPPATAAAPAPTPAPADERDRRHCRASCDILDREG